jgi:hypothetical protein
MSVSSSDVTCRVLINSARWRTGQNATSSRLAGRLTFGAALSCHCTLARGTVMPGVTGLK